MATSSDSDPLFPLYLRAARQNCAAGYYDSPEVYSGMRFELRRIPTVYSRVVKQKEKKWELWSPNSSQTPFLPGWRIPGSLPTLPKLLEDRRYDGHVGRMDCLFSPHYFGEDVPHWPFIRRQHMVLSNDFAYAAYEPLMNQWAVDRDDRRMGRFRPEYVERLSALRRELDERMEEIKARLRSGSTTWSSRPQYATPTVITELLGTRFWWDAVDRGVGVQRGLREKEAWVTMMHARRSIGEPTLEQLRGVEFPPADERFLGVWVNGLNERSVLCNLFAGIPCFIVHAYEPEDTTRADVYPYTTVQSDFVTGTDIVREVLEGPYQKLARRDATRLDALLNLATRASPVLTATPEEAKSSSSLYLEQMGILPATWKRSDFEPNATWIDLLGWRKRSAVQTAIPRAVPKPAPSAPAILSPAFGDPSTKKDRFEHRQWEVREIHPSRVAWIVPPKVAVADPKGKWAKYELAELESGRTAFVYRGKKHEPESSEKYFDREKKRRIYLGSYERPVGVVSGEVFGVPVPQLPFVVMNGLKETTEKPSYWMYKKEQPAEGDVGRRATEPRAEDLPFREG
ncbi:hypothetical protein R3P38DRAFT_2555653, partial [Favolaschia claudopus]